MNTYSNKFISQGPILINKESYVKSDELFLNYETVEVNTVFAYGTEFSGELQYSCPLKIQGKFKGKINTDSFLWIDNDAEVEAEVVAGTVKLGGKFTGNIYAKNKIELLPNAKFYGGIKAARVKIADGVLFEGNCEMID